MSFPVFSPNLPRPNGNSSAEMSPKSLFHTSKNTSRRGFPPSCEARFVIIIAPILRNHNELWRKTPKNGVLQDVKQALRIFEFEKSRLRKIRRRPMLSPAPQPIGPFVRSGHISRLGGVRGRLIKWEQGNAGRIRRGIGRADV